MLKQDYFLKKHTNVDDHSNETLFPLPCALRTQNIVKGKGKS